jgi:hypothetical protein
MNQCRLVAISLALIATVSCSSSPGKGNGGRAGVGGASGSAGDGASGTQGTGGPDARGSNETGDGSDGRDEARGDVPAETSADARTDSSTFSCPAQDGDANIPDPVLDGGYAPVANIVPGCPFPRDPVIFSAGDSASLGAAIVANDDGGSIFATDATYRWESRNARCGGSGGTFDTPTASGTNFTCSLPGRTTLMLHIGRLGTTCDYVWNVDIECEVGDNPAATISVSSTTTTGWETVDVFTDGSAVRTVWPLRLGEAPSPPPRTFAAGSAEGTKLLTDLALVGDVSVITSTNCGQSPQVGSISIRAGGVSSGDLHCLRAPTAAETALVQDCFALTGTQ